MDSPQDSRVRWLYPLLLIVAGLVLLLPGTWSLPLVDRDEPRFARATQEMIERGSWAVPYFNEEYRFDKPPLTYWWMSLAYMIFGENEFGARAHSIFSTLLLVLLVYHFGARMFDRRAGFWAAFGFLSCFKVMLHARLSVADMPMMLFIVLASYAAWGLITQEEEERGFTRHFWLFWVSLGFGFLAKWVVPMAVLGATLGLYWILHGRKEKFLTRTVLLRFRPFIGIWVTGAIIASWAVPAWIETEGAFFTQGFNTHVIERGAEAMNDRTWIPGFYFLTALLSLMPWMGWIGLVIHNTREHWGRESAFLLAWMVGPYLMFSVAQTQLPHYVMPAFPAFFLLLFRDGNDLPWPGWASKAWFWIYQAVLVLPTSAYLYLMILHSPEAERESGVFLSFSVGISIVLFVFSISLLGLIARRPRWIRIVAVALAMAFFWGAAGQRSQGWLAAQQVADLYAKLEISEGSPRALGYTEPSLIFYTGETWERAGVEQYTPWQDQLREERGQFLVLLEKEWSIESGFGWMLRGEGALPPSTDRSEEILTVAPEGYIRETVSGFNFGRFSWVRLVIFAPEPPVIAADEPGERPALVSHQ